MCPHFILLLCSHGGTTKHLLRDITGAPLVVACSSSSLESTKTTASAGPPARTPAGIGLRFLGALCTLHGFPLAPPRSRYFEHPLTAPSTLNYAPQNNGPSSRLVKPLKSFTGSLIAVRDESNGVGRGFPWGEIKNASDKEIAIASPSYLSVTWARSIFGQAKTL
jgi:hypothetical protein